MLSLKGLNYLNYHLFSKRADTNKAGELSIFPIKSKEKTVPGQLNPNNAEYVLSIIKQATHDCLNKTCNGILTGPINKAVINQAGIKFSGHTEYLAELSNCSKTVMLLATAKLKVALATTHLALKDVPKNITKESLTEVISIINNDFKYLGVNNPSILVCGLNPHAGENGYLGDEEIKTITPCDSNTESKWFQAFWPCSSRYCFYC